jgi:hypothetical protein
VKANKSYKEAEKEAISSLLHELKDSSIIGLVQLTNTPRIITKP